MRVMARKDRTRLLTLPGMTAWAWEKRDGEPENLSVALGQF